MTIQTTGPNGILYKLVERALIEAHRNDLVKFNIVNTEKLKQEFRDALKKDYDIKDIDESDILFCFEEVDQNEVEQKEDSGEVQGTGSEEENNDDSEVSDDSDTDNSKDDTESSENDTEDDGHGEEDTGSDEESNDDSEPSFGITGDDNKEDNSQDNDSEEDDEEDDETVKAVKEAIMKEEEEGEKDQGEEESDQGHDEQGDEIENATEKDKDDAEGTTMGSSKTKENVVKAVARALYIDNPDDIQMFDINYQNKRCFFIKANIRK